ncbi:hypothetical protein C7N83_11785 [Neisseria iguanae]|uniref:Uncharacterized protein n=1 Tax=Neisseria iguanae TaxID=90242 RepID=A0A2P7TXN8_9NEIS|nr:hypothetical protein C7N83_11785 [Neisseria iguanae]
MLFLFVFALTLLVYAADTQGCIVFWQHHGQAEMVTVTKNTAENASAEEAKTELEAFCQVQGLL